MHCAGRFRTTFWTPNCEIATLTIVGSLVARHLAGTFVTWHVEGNRGSLWSKISIAIPCWLTGVFKLKYGIASWKLTRTIYPCCSRVNLIGQDLRKFSTIFLAENSGRDGQLISGKLHGWSGLLWTFHFVLLSSNWLLFLGSAFDDVLQLICKHYPTWGLVKVRLGLQVHPWFWGPKYLLNLLVTQCAQELFWTFISPIGMHSMGNYQLLKLTLQILGPPQVQMIHHSQGVSCGDPILMAETSPLACLTCSEWLCGVVHNQLGKRPSQRSENHNRPEMRGVSCYAETGLHVALPYEWRLGPSNHVLQLARGLWLRLHQLRLHRETNALCAGMQLLWPCYWGPCVLASKLVAGSYPASLRILDCQGAELFHMWNLDDHFQACACSSAFHLQLPILFAAKVHFPEGDLWVSAFG